ncbi:MAG: hypothetical protein NVSMB22_00060 [Chloroflexota bacterium]
MTVATLLLAITTLACGGAHNTLGGGLSPRNRTGLLLSDATSIYEQAGLIATGPPIPFVGAFRYLRSRSTDSTLVLVVLSMPNSALTFVRDSDRYRATYSVTIDVKDTGRPVRTLEVRDVVRIPTFRETVRPDESIIFQQYFNLTPGVHRLTLAVRDGEGMRSSTRDVTVTVPRVQEGNIATPVSVYEGRSRNTVDSFPHLVPNPRSTVVFGRDSIAALYLEAYGGVSPRAQLRFAVHDGASRAVVYSDTTSLTRNGGLYSGILSLPVSRMAVGLATISIWRSDYRDTTTTPVFVSFGENLPVASFEEMLNYLRYFTTPERLRSLRDTAPEYRSAAWSEFLRQTDPVISTPEHEGLRDYFGRLQRANERFREEGIPGWQTERGAVFITLGEPDQVFEQQRSDATQRGRVQVWEYSQFRVQLMFVDQTGFGRWRLTASSDAEFQSLARRVRRG